MSKTVVVAGGAGFIGFHLIKRLLEEGESVECVDNISTGSMDNILSFVNSSRFHFTKHYIVQPLEIKREVKCIPISRIKYVLN